MMTYASVKSAYKDYLNTPHGCDVYTDFKRILYSTEDSLVEYLNNDVIQHSAGAMRRELHVCDIGGGDGYRVSRIADYCVAKFQTNPIVDVVEQSEEFCRRSRMTLHSASYDRHVVHAAFEDASLEPAAYDLVLLIHSIFALSNASAIEKAFGLPRPGGCVITVTNDESSFLGGLKRIVDAKFDDRRYEVSDFEADLRRLNVQYERRTFETRWAIADELLDDRMRLILEWISLGAYAAFGKRERDELKEYFMAKSDSVEGRRLFHEQEVVLIATSPLRE